MADAPRSTGAHLGGAIKLLGAAMGEPSGVDQSTEAVRGLLSDIEIRATVRRFGLEDGQLRTLSEVARELGIDKDEVHRLTTSALSKLQALVLEHRPPPAGAVGYGEFSVALYPGATEASSSLARSLHKELRKAQYLVEPYLVLREGDLYVHDTCILRSRFQADGSLVVELRIDAPPFEGMEPATSGWFSRRIAPGKVLGWVWSEAVAKAAVQAGATPSRLFGL